MVAKRLTNLLLPFVGVALALLVWWAASLKVPDLPSPARTWEESRIYIVEPFEKRGETDQGILLLASYSLVRVGQGFLLGIAIATPLGFLLGVSPTLQERYLSAAEVISALAIGDVKTPAVTETYRVPQDASQNQHIEGLPLGTMGGLRVDRVVPLHGAIVPYSELLKTQTPTKTN